MKLQLSSLLLLTVLPISSLCAQAQPEPATLRSLLLHQLRTTHNKAEWFVPINAAVGELTAEQANWQPGKDSHSAGQIAYHLLFWNQRNLNTLRGVNNNNFSADNKETFDRFDKKQWADVVKQLDQVMTDLEKVVEAADDQQLAKWANTIGICAPTMRITLARSSTSASYKVPGIQIRA